MHYYYLLELAEYLFSNRPALRRCSARERAFSGPLIFHHLPPKAALEVSEGRGRERV